MKILLTGPGSFVGKVVLAKLLALGHEVTVISRAPLPADVEGRVTPIYSDLRQVTSLPSNHEAVIHIAATSPMAGVGVNEYINNNILSTANLINLACIHGATKLIFLSTLSVYGDVSQEVITESTPIFRPNMYGASKLMCEAMLNEQTAFKSLAIRLPAVIGRGAARHWLANIIERFKVNEDITIYNPNAIFNNAIHVQNLADFICDLLNMEFNKHFDFINVASLGGMEISTLVEQIKIKLASSSNIKIAAAAKKGFTISTDYARSNYLFKPLDFSAAFVNYLNEC